VIYDLIHFLNDYFINFKDESASGFGSTEVHSSQATIGPDFAEF